VVSLCEVEAKYSPYWMRRIEKDRVVPFIEGSEKYGRRQLLPKVYRMNGAIYVTKYSVLMAEDRELGEDVGQLL
jgi:N-acylneuraminate cytidylyltransferase/CMP-N,N'-diacetyllegionaminic acid synthase